MLRIHDQIYETTLVSGYVQCLELGIRCHEDDLVGEVDKIVAGRSVHQCRVDRLMRRIEAFVGKHGPRYSLVDDLSDAEAEFRAKLMLEEMLELVIGGLGVDITVIGEKIMGVEDLVLTKRRKVDLLAVLDGVCDVSVTAVGTASCCGLGVESALSAVDENNLTKLGKGAWAREDGKIMKPPGFVPVDLTKFVK